MNSSELKAQFQVLQQAYSQQLLGKIEEIDRTWQQLQVDPTHPEWLPTLHRLAHRIAGSGATFGFKALSDCSRALENYCSELMLADPPLSWERMAQISELIAAMRQAVVAPPPVMDPPPSRIYFYSDDPDLSQRLQQEWQNQGYHVQLLPSPSPEAPGMPVFSPSSPPKPADSASGIPCPEVSPHPKTPEDLANESDLWIRTMPSVGSEAERIERVMVVDDDSEINQLLQKWLQVCGYQVEAAFSGEEALLRLEEARPDLIFLDILMEGMSGLEVLQEVRQRGLDIGVIMTTAYGSIKVAIDALRRGADDYLHKPFDLTEFQAVLKRTVERLSLRRQNASLSAQLQAEMARAAQIQAELLPRQVPVLSGFELAARCIPAREVSGDFYDWQTPATGVLNLTLGDVMGKGLPSALLMATVRAAMRAVSRQTDPEMNIYYAARALEPDLLRSESFVTLFHAQLDTESQILKFIDAGHGHVLLLRANGSIERLSPRGVPLGALPGDPYFQGSIRFQVGDALILYSDGLLDAYPSLEEDFSPIIALLQQVSSAREAVEKIMEMAVLTETLADDLTVLILRCTGDFETA
ncbi:MAG: SpoIIE family protein phosphatase [Cyanobacteriota bacterium]|nr:SpoIIE family protein phosphatase [Cyanobacteriota bacterium]